MNAEDKWVELWKEATYEEDGSVGFGPDLDDVKAIGDEMVSTIEELRKINHVYFHKVTELQNKIDRQYGGQEDN